MVNALSGSAALAGRLPPRTTAPQHGTGPLPWFSLFAAGHVPLHDSLHNIHVTTIDKGVATLHDLYSVRGATRTLFFAAVLGEAGRPGHAYVLSASSRVSTPRAAASVAAEAQRAWQAASAQTVLCSGCGKGDGEASMLLCDASLPPCGVGYHLACCSPPLASPPAGHWYCPTHSWGSLAARPSVGGGSRCRRSEEPTPQDAASTSAPTFPGGDSVTSAAARRASLNQAAAARRETHVLRAARRAAEAAAAAAIPLEPPSCMLSPPFRTLRGSLLAPPAPREQPSRSAPLAGSRTTPPRPPAFLSCVSPLRQIAGVFATYREALAHGVRSRGTHFAITGPFPSFEMALADTRARVAAAVHALPDANLGVSAGASVSDGTQPFPHAPDQVGPPLHTPPRPPPSYGGSSCSQDECTQPAPPDDDLPDGEEAPDTSTLAVTPTTTLPSPQGATPPTAGAPTPPSPRPPSPRPPSPHLDGATLASSPRSARLLFLVGIPLSASCVCGSDVPALQSAAWSSLLRSATATSASGGPPLGIRVLPEGGLIVTNVDGTHLLDPSAAEPVCSGVHLELLARSIRSLALFHGQVLPPFDITLAHTPCPPQLRHQESYPAFGDAGLLGATTSPALTLLAHNIEQQLCELGDVRASSTLAVWLGAVNSTLAPDFIALSEVGRRFDGSGLHTLGFDPVPHGFYIAAAACRAEPGSAASGSSAQVVQGGGVMLLAALRWLPFDASRKPGAPGPSPSASPALAVCDFRTSTGLLSVVAAYLPTHRPDNRHAAETSTAIATLDALLQRAAQSPSLGLTHDFVGLGDWNVALPSCTAGLATPGTADTALDFTFTAFNEARGLTPNARLLYGLMGKHKLAPLCDVGTPVSATFAGKGVVPPSAIDWVMGAGAMRNDPRAYHVLHLQSPICPPFFTADSQLGAATMQLQGAAEDHFPVLCSIGVPWTCAALLPPPYLCSLLGGRAGVALPQPPPTDTHGWRRPRPGPLLHAAHSTAHTANPNLSMAPMEASFTAVHSYVAASVAASTPVLDHTPKAARADPHNEASFCALVSRRIGLLASSFPLIPPPGAPHLWASATRRPGSATVIRLPPDGDLEPPDSDSSPDATTAARKAYAARVDANCKRQLPQVAASQLNEASLAFVSMMLGCAAIAFGGTLGPTPPPPTGAPLRPRCTHRTAACQGRMDVVRAWEQARAAKIAAGRVARAASAAALTAPSAVTASTAASAATSLNAAELRAAEAASAVRKVNRACKATDLFLNATILDRAPASTAGWAVTKTRMSGAPVPTGAAEPSAQLRGVNGNPCGSREAARTAVAQSLKERVCPQHMRAPAAGTFSSCEPKEHRKLPIPDFLCYEELREAVRRPAGQAKGLNGTSPSLLRLMPPQALFYLGALFETMTEHALLPPAFASEIYIALPKPKKDHLSLKGWRGITVLTAEARLFLKAVGRAFNQHWYLWMDEWQVGFAPNAMPMSGVAYKQWAAALRHEHGLARAAAGDTLESNVWGTACFMADADMGYDRANFTDFSAALAHAGLSPRRARALTLIHELGQCVSSTGDRSYVSPVWMTRRGAGQGVPPAPFLWNAVLAYTVLRSLHARLDDTKSYSADGWPTFRIGVPLPPDPYAAPDSPPRVRWLGHMIWADDFCFCFRTVDIAADFAGYFAATMARAGLGMSFPKSCVVPLQGACGLPTAALVAVSLPRSPAADAAADLLYSAADADADAASTAERSRLDALPGAPFRSAAGHAADDILVRRAGEAARLRAPPIQPFRAPPQLHGFVWIYLGGDDYAPMEVFRDGVAFPPDAPDGPARAQAAALRINTQLATAVGGTAVTAHTASVLPLPAVTARHDLLLATTELLASIAGTVPRGRRKHVGRRMPLRLQPHGADLGFTLGTTNAAHIRAAAQSLRTRTVTCYGAGISGRNVPPVTALATALQLAWSSAAQGLELVGGPGEELALAELANADNTFTATMLNVVVNSPVRTGAGSLSAHLSPRTGFNTSVAQAELGMLPLAHRIAQWRLNMLATFTIGVPLKAARDLFNDLFDRYRTRPGAVGPVDRALAHLTTSARAHNGRPRPPTIETPVQLVGTMALALFFGLDLDDFAPPPRPLPPSNPAPADPARLAALKTAIRRAVTAHATSFLEDDILWRASERPSGHTAWLMLHGMTLPHRHVAGSGYVLPLAVNNSARVAYVKLLDARKAAQKATLAAAGFHRTHLATYAADALRAAARAAACTAESADAAALDSYVRTLHIREGATEAAAIRTSCCTHLPALHGLTRSLALATARDTTRAASEASSAASLARHALLAYQTAPAPLPDAVAAPQAAAAGLALHAALAAEATAMARAASARVDTCPYCRFCTGDASVFAYTLEHIFVTCTAAAFTVARAAMFAAARAALAIPGDPECGAASAWLDAVASAPLAPFRAGTIDTLLRRREARRSACLAATPAPARAAASADIALERDREAATWGARPTSLTNAGVFAALMLGSEGARGTDSVVGVPGCNSDEAQLRTQLAGASFLQHMHAAWSRAPGAGPTAPTDDHHDDDVSAAPPPLSALFRSAETGVVAASEVPPAAVVASPAQDANPLAVAPAGGGTAVPGEGGAAPTGLARRRLGIRGDAYPPGYPSSARFRARRAADRTAPDDDPLSEDAATRDVAALLRPPRRARGAAAPAAPAPEYIAGQIYVHGHLQLLVAGDAPAAASAEELEELDADEAIV